jgi:hypothetical protein
MRSDDMLERAAAADGVDTIGVAQRSLVVRDGKLGGGKLADPDAASWF